MEAVIIANLIALGIVAAGNILRLRNLLPLAIVFLILFYGVRTYYSNDFLQYLNGFNQLTSISGILAGNVDPWEPGWKLLNRMFKPLGFQGLIFFLTIIQFGTFGKFLHQYVSRSYQIGVLAIYLFYPPYMLIDLGMLRQGLAISIIMWAVPFILRKRWIIFAALVCLAASFHYSAWVCVVLPLIYYLRNIKWQVFIILMGVITIFCFTASSLVFKFAYAMIDIVSSRYLWYLRVTDAKEITTGLGVAFQVLVGIYIGWLLRYKSTGNRFFILCYLVNFAFLPLGQLAGGFSRLGNYFAALGIISYSEIFRRVRQDPLAMLITIGYGLYIMKDFVGFFYSPTFSKYYMEYHTILTFH